MAHQHSGHSHESHQHAHAQEAHHHHHHDEGEEDELTGDRRHFEDVVAAFRGYRADGMARVARLTGDFGRVPKEQRVLLTSYVGKLSAMRQAVDGNAAFIALLVENVDMFHRGFEGPPLVHEPSADALDKVHSTLRQFVRDWAVEGAAERHKCYQPMLDEVQRRFPLQLPRDLNRYRVLVPGCGLGRLVWDFAQQGYATQGNEFSYHMLLASNWVLNHSGGANTAALFPYALASSNRVAVAQQFTRVTVPHVDTRALPDGVDMSMNAGEFVQVYSDAEFASSFDVVAAPFFLDTAHNAVDYMRAIWHVLRPGGVWIHVGPLLWHYTDQPSELQVELSLEEVLHAARLVGFELDVRPPIVSTYAADPSAMMATVYQCAFFVASKPEPKMSGAE